MLLALCFILGMIPITVFADNGGSGGGTSPDETTNVVIASFEELPGETLFQGYDFGKVKDQSTLDLPSKLTATDDDNDTVTINGVTWKSKPKFDGSVSQLYEFAPVLPKGYTLADGVKAPVILVFVQPKGGVKISPFAQSVGNASALKTALEGASSDTITVTADMTLSSSVTIGADHTLVIDNGKTLTIGNGNGYSGTLNVSAGKTLTVQGQGTLKVANSLYFGIMVYGNMVVNGTNLTVANTNAITTGIDVSGSLSIQNGSNLQIENSGNNHGIIGNLSIKDSIASISNTVNGTVVYDGIQVTPNHTLIIDNSTVTVSNSGNDNSIGIYSYGDIEIINGSHVILTPTANAIGIRMNVFSSPTSLLIDNSILDLQSGLGMKQYASPSDVSFTGANGGIVRLVQGADVAVAIGKLKDQGNTLTATGTITVGAASATTSTTGLTAGDYVWDGTYFSKGGTQSYAVNIIKGTANPTSAVEGAVVALTAGSAPAGQQFKEWSITPAVTFIFGTTKNSPTAYFIMPAQAVSATAVSEAIPVGDTIEFGGTTGVSDITQNAAGTGWAWDAASATLTLSTGYNGGQIYFNTTNAVKLILSDSVTIADTALSYAIKSDGDLTIDAGNSTLNLSSNHDTGNPCVIGVDGNLIITGGTVNAEYISNNTSGIAIYAFGDVTVENSAVVTAKATGTTGGGGIESNSGDIIIKDNSTVTNKCFGYGNALRANSVTISGNANVVASSENGWEWAIVSWGGDVTISDNANLNSTKIDNSDISASGNIFISTTGTVTATGTLGFYALNTITGSTYVSSGTVKIYNTDNMGFVRGTLNKTGGTVYLNDVLSVTVNPSSATVQKGSSYQFGATVAGINNPSQAVAWSVSGNNDISTNISSSGLLTVAAGETSTTLTVTAISTVNSGKFGTATVTVSHTGRSSSGSSGSSSNNSSGSGGSSSNNTGGYIGSSSNNTGGSNSYNTSSSNTSTSIAKPNYSGESKYDGYNDAYGNQVPSPSSKFSYRTIIDSKSDISVYGLFTQSAKLVVTPLKETGSIAAYDISVDAEYSGMVEVSIPVDAKYNGKDIYIVHKMKDKTENIKATVENGYVKFKVSSFSPFILKESLANGEELANNQTMGAFYNPNTGGGLPEESSTVLALKVVIIPSTILWIR